LETEFQVSVPETPARAHAGSVDSIVAYLDKLLD
jgi:hypothetical protein